MGSLMAGWDSPVHDPKSVKLMRNKSLTRERIEEYWSLKKKTEEEHLQAVANNISPPESQESLKEASSHGYKRCSSMPTINTKDGHLLSRKDEQPDPPVDLQDMIKTNCWWTRSNSAFLNEPPVIAEVPSKHKYATQHNVANLANNTADNIKIAGV